MSTRKNRWIKPRQRSNSQIGVRGRVQIYIDGVKVGEHHNLVVNDGFEAIWKAFAGDATYAVSSFEGGTGTTAPAAGDTALQTSAFGPKALTSVSFPSLAAIKLTLDIIPGEATGVAFTEFGLFTTSGQLVARIVDGNTYTKTALNTIQIVWDLTLSV